MTTLEKNKLLFVVLDVESDLFARQIVLCFDSQSDLFSRQIVLCCVLILYSDLFSRRNIQSVYNCFDQFILVQNFLSKIRI